MVINFSVEPFESNTVIYQRVAAPTQGAASVGMLYFAIHIANHGPPVTLTEIAVSFPGSTEPAASFLRNQKIGASATVWLTDKEVFKLTKSPTEIEIRLSFAGTTPPVTMKSALGPHQVSYPLFVDGGEFP